VGVRVRIDQPHRTGTNRSPRLDFLRILRGSNLRRKRWAFSKPVRAIEAPRSGGVPVLAAGLGLKLIPYGSSASPAYYYVNY